MQHLICDPSATSSDIHLNYESTPITPPTCAAVTSLLLPGDLKPLARDAPQLFPGSSCILGPLEGFC